LPVIYGLRSAYANWVDDDEVYSIDLAPLALAATSGASISAWSWDIGDGTITDGADDGQDITVEFPAGFRWIHLTVTDDGGRSQTMHIPVWAHHPVDYPPQFLAADQLRVAATVEGGYDATVGAFDGVGGLLDNTLVVAWNGD